MGRGGEKGRKRSGRRGERRESGGCGPWRRTVDDVGEVDDGRASLVHLLKQRVAVHAQQLPVGVLAPLRVHAELGAVGRVVELGEQAEEPAVLALLAQLVGERVGVPATCGGLGVTQQLGL